MLSCAVLIACEFLYYGTCTTALQASICSWTPLDSNPCAETLSYLFSYLYSLAQWLVHCRWGTSRIIGIVGRFGINKVLVLFGSPSVVTLLKIHSVVVFPGPVSLVFWIHLCALSLSHLTVPILSAYLPMSLLYLSLTLISLPSSNLYFCLLGMFT